MQKNIETNVIRKVRKEKEFAQISNDLINNRELSYKALGMLTYILSKPDDWQVYMSDLIRDGIEGEKSVRNGLNELIEKKYIQRYRVYNKDTGKVHHWETLVSETPFPEAELISSVKETYALDKEGNIIYQKVVLGTFERFIPVVINREVSLLSQKGNVEKNKEVVTTLPKGTSRKPTSRKRSTTNTNITKTDSLTNTNSSSSSKGKATELNHFLIELFNDSICELKNTTRDKFMKYVDKYDNEFIKAVINYCEERNAKSYSYFEKVINGYIKRGIVTVEDMNKDIEQFKDENRIKKNNAIKEKEEKKREEDFENKINEMMLDDLAGENIEENNKPISLQGDDIGEQVVDLLKDAIGESALNIWIKPAKIVIDGNDLYIGCPNGFSAEIVNTRYKKSIKEALNNKGIEVDVKVVKAE
ncbi:DnaA N-terminal domain-containing protein [Clostridium sp.]|jgi:DnaD/phage-associated family protein|uniref:DnaA N-terminal domain-containing protein n=1 Tax=Clostridium sp. TaxID=1506 RepID=UPI0025BD6FFE|nr:DnaD domain protein [Clostridium sp.]MCI9070839.1 DnaD domain protein [Clostridium sp.]